MLWTIPERRRLRPLSAHRKSERLARALTSMVGPVTTAPPETLRRTRLRAAAGTASRPRSWSLRIPWVILGAAELAAVAVLMHAGRGGTFFYDEWSFVLGRAGHSLGVFLQPHNEHPVVFPVLIYKTLFSTVGLSSYWVYRFLHVGLIQLLATLVFAYASPRLGRWGALGAAVPLSLMGLATEYVLEPFELTFTLSLLGGVSAFLCLDTHRSSRWDFAASVLLVIATFSSGIGVCFLIGVLLEVALRREWRRAIRVLAAPVALFSAWWPAYGTAGTARFSNLVHVPTYAEQAYNAATSALTTLLVLSPVLAVALVAMIAVRLLRIGPARGLVALSPRFWASLAVPFAFWTETTMSRWGITPPNAGRYMFPGAVMVVLVTCEAFSGCPTLGWPRYAPLLLASLGVIFLNDVGFLRDNVAGRPGADPRVPGYSWVVKPELAALQLVANAPPGYAPDPLRAPQLTAGPYFAAIKRYDSSPAASLAATASAAPDARAGADRILREAAAIHLAPLVAMPTASVIEPPLAVKAFGGRVRFERGGCLVLRPVSRTAMLLLVASGSGLVVMPEGHRAVTVDLRRFASAYVSVGIAAGRKRAIVSVPSSHTRSYPWHFQLLATQPAVACALR